MIIRGPETVRGRELEGSHGGKGAYYVRTLLEKEFSSSLKHVRDLTLRGYSSIGEHLHLGDEELYYVISGEGTMIVDGEEQPVGPGDVVLTKSGSRHALQNNGESDLRILVVCADWEGKGLS